MNKKTITLVLALVITTAVCFTACGNNDDNPSEPTEPTNIAQPDPVAPDDTFSGTIGFWDFVQNGTNAVGTDIPGRSGNWFINGVGFNYNQDGLVIDKTATPNDFEKNRVQLINAKQGGLAQQRYFSGAIKFKIIQDPNEALTYTLLSFGLNPRFLDLMVWNGKITMRTKNSNIVKDTNIEVKTNVWNVLYYRYEGFTPPIGDNNFYVQLNNGPETTINLETFSIDNYAGNNNNINIGFSSAGTYPFKGNIDWIILGLGRMTPANAQYLVQDFKN